MRLDAHSAHDLVGSMVRSREHLRNPLFGGEHERQAIRPSVFDELAIEIFRAVSRKQARTPQLSGGEGWVLFIFVQRRG